jgi:hypothetical protein
MAEHNPITGTGAPGTELIELPEGLDWDTVEIAVRAVEVWEIRGDGLATDLVIELFKILSRRNARSSELLHKPS